MSARIKLPGSDIWLSPILPSIPDRRFDWCAYHDDTEADDAGYFHAGWGKTKDEALADLARMDRERHECQMLDKGICPDCERKLADCQCEIEP